MIKIYTRKGKPFARRGRKTMDLTEIARLPKVKARNRFLFCYPHLLATRPFRKLSNGEG